MKFATLLFILLCGIVHAAETTWKAGVSKAVITPKEPM